VSILLATRLAHFKSKSFPCLPAPMHIPFQSTRKANRRLWSTIALSRRLILFPPISTILRTVLLSPARLSVGHLRRQRSFDIQLTNINLRRPLYVKLSMKLRLWMQLNRLHFLQSTSIMTAHMYDRRASLVAKTADANVPFA
jgi:hypothetical protein